MYLCFFFFSFFGLFLLCLLFGGFKGQVRWPFGPPHLALNPPYLFLSVLFFLFFFVLFFPFLSLLLTTKKTFFPPRKGNCLFIFGCLPLFLLSLFWPPPVFNFSFSLSVSLLFFSFFLASFLLSFFSFLLIPCFSLFLSFSFFFAFVSWQEQHQNIQLQLVFHQYFLFIFGFLSFFFRIPSYSYLLFFFFFLILSYDFCSTSMFLVSKNQVEKHQFLVKRGVATKRFLWTCVLQNVKSYRFCLGHFWQILVALQKTL